MKSEDNDANAEDAFRHQTEEMGKLITHTTKTRD